MQWAIGRFGIIEPQSTWKQLWDWVILLLVVYNSIKIPLDISFQPGDALDDFDYTVDALFFLDMVLSFRHSYYDPLGNPVRDSRRIAMEYLNTWFCIDFVAAFPAELLFLAVAGASNGQSRMIGVLKIPRLLRIGRLLKKLDQMQAAVMIRIMVQLLNFLLMAHIVACIWFSIGDFENHERNWVDDDEDIRDKRVITQYTSALYWALTTMTTVGYGDITPTTVYERWYTMFVYLVGAISYSSIFANVSLLLAGFDEVGQRYRAKLKVMEEMLRFTAVPPDLADRVKLNVDYNWAVTGGFDVSQAMGQLPRALRCEVCMCLYERVVRQAPMFANMHSALIKEIVLALKPTTALPGDWIFHEGDVGHEMVFVGHGSVEVVSTTDYNVVLAVLGEGTFFGETALFFHPARRTAGIRAQTKCVLFVMDKDAMEKVLLDFPVERDEIVAIAKTRRAQNVLNNQKKIERLTDARSYKSRHTSAGAANRGPRSHDAQDVLGPRLTRPRNELLDKCLTMPSPGPKSMPGLVLPREGEDDAGEGRDSEVGASQQPSPLPGASGADAPHEPWHGNSAQPSPSNIYASRERQAHKATQSVPETDFFGDRETQSTAGGSLTDDERNNAETVVAEAGTIRQPRLSETKLPNAESTSLARISDINHAPRELLGPLMGPPRITGQLDSMQEEISGVKRAVGSLEERVTRMMQVVERIEVCIMKISCGLLQYWRLSLHF